MKVRLISGEFGGRYLVAPDTDRTHPMGERIRGALFNILGDVDGYDVLDAFAGTGSIGLEALSRDARSVILIEDDRAAQDAIARNIETLGVMQQAKLVKTTVARWVDTAARQRFDIIFVDPPYGNMQLSTVASLVGYLKPKGLMILSHPGREQAPTVNGVVVVDKRSYGDAALAFYQLDNPT